MTVDGLVLLLEKFAVLWAMSVLFILVVICKSNYGASARHTYARTCLAHEKTMTWYKMTLVRSIKLKHFYVD
ncbi:hypothetical protein KIN20_033352 [Parelaphostrongylus tenuis]|uniref:Uncharacterized protein n=1 Tax=Parelaphostrongylus tenuis TaxID=148309 RepID=A0AAD5R8E8_PARTN|nr:hypothetical protein KIN20_033352 [Parelaphostrongylus tenuis]